MDPIQPSSSRSASAGSLETRSLIWSMVGLGMLVMISFIGAWTLREVSKSDYWVDHTRDVIRENQQLLSDVREAESAERGYIISGDEHYLAPFRTAVQNVGPSQAHVAQLTADNAAQQQRLKTLEALISERITVLNRAVQERQNTGFSAAQNIVVSGQGLAMMKQITDASSALEVEEYRLLQERSQRRQSRLRNGYLAVLAASVLALIALLSAPFDVRRAVRQRNLAARAREESESTTLALFRAASQGIVIVDQRGRITMANPATSSMFGYSPEELIGQSIEVLVPENMRPGHVGYRDHYFHDPQNRPMGAGRDLQARRKDGTEFPAEISLSYIRSGSGIQAVAFVTDISKRKADERAIRQQREELRNLAAQLMTAQDDERRRIARDLHDDLSQRLAFLSMDLSKLAASPSAGALASELRPLQRRATEASETVRRISHQLHPSVLDDIGLEAALEQYCQDFERHSGISTQFTAHEVPDSLRPEIARSIFHIAQECLRNVSKHAQTETVEVILELKDGLLRLIVRDQGIGLTTDRRGPQGIGMVAMKERAHLVNGRLSVQSQKGEGTEVSVEVPVASV